ncbi:SHOCT domain-containing protein [Micromonospora sp. MS34]|uniref:SHOCT domain-containing protein n=1 Tax=Micromonospora sp. MS34 TaxID=3385971 RepID=UPI0039A37142
MMGYGWGMGMGGWIFMALFWIVVVGLIVWGVSVLLPRTRSDQAGRPERPEEILDRRFALGEIDVEQYRRAREDLAAARSARR